MCKKQDVKPIEFLDFCKDDMYEEVQETYDAYPNKV